VTTGNVNVNVCAAPVEEAPSPDYRVTVNGRAVFVYRARVSAQPINQIWPGYQRPLEQTELAAFATWDMTGPVEVEVSSARPIRDVRVRPASRGIRPTRAGQTHAARNEGDAVLKLVAVQMR